MYRRYLLVLSLMILLTPLGLLAEGTAWGEWGSEELAQIAGFIPQGLEQAEAQQKALLPDYKVAVLGEGAAAASLGYISSAIIGAVLAYAAVMLLCRLVVKGNKQIIKGNKA